MSYNLAKSSSRRQELGVSQGSKTGPQLFDIYSSDFNKLCPNESSTLYADDTVLVYVGNSLDDLANHVNNKLRNVVDWCNCNKLALNPSKSEFMIVTNKIITSRPQLFIGASPITEVGSFKYLGVHIDAQLKFHTRFHHIRGKLSQLCGVTYGLRSFLNLQAAKNLYYSCIFSVIPYCIGTWGGVSQCTSRSDDIDRIHGRIVRTLFCSFYPNKNSQNSRYL